MKAACLMSRWRLSASVDDIRAPLRAGAGLPPGRGTLGTGVLTPVQGQKMSFESANSIREMITASPPAIRRRKALSDGGRPVTASNA